MKIEDKNLYYVGGVVRDAILGLPSVDTDYCYEGNAIDYAQDNGLNIMRKNPEFGTVRVRIDDNLIDIASTRIEEYPQKGHLPVIKKLGCSLEEDLKRRDFTINAMAMRTTDGEIIDFNNSLQDLQDKKLRILHENSFIDDPTRIIRGLKFAVRFGFELEEETKKLQDRYLDNVNYDMSFFRLKKELVDAFSLNKKEVFQKFIEQKMYRLLGKNQIFPIANTEKLELLASQCRKEYRWLIYLSFFDLSNLELTRGEKRILEWAEKLKSESPSGNTPPESLLIHSIREDIS